MATSSQSGPNAHADDVRYDVIGDLVEEGYSASEAKTAVSFAIGSEYADIMRNALVFLKRPAGEAVKPPVIVEKKYCWCGREDRHVGRHFGSYKEKPDPQKLSSALPSARAQHVHSSQTPAQKGEKAQGNGVATPRHAPLASVTNAAAAPEISAHGESAPKLQPLDHASWLAAYGRSRIQDARIEKLIAAIRALPVPWIGQMEVPAGFTAKRSSLR